MFLHSQLKVQMHNGDVYEASIRDIDKKSDIATIKINPQVSRQAVCNMQMVYLNDVGHSFKVNNVHVLDR